MTTMRQIPAPVVPSRSRLKPLGLDEVKITGGFWGHKQHVNSTATLAHCHDWIERSGWVDNFRSATAGSGEHHGMPFADSEIYKLMEALAWDATTRNDGDAEARFEILTQAVANAQQPDGYLHTAFGGPEQEPRYSDLEWGHELYCYGHMIQAAVARARTAGQDRFASVAERVADHVCQVFGPGGTERVGGHPEIEMALVELARATGNEKYLSQATAFVDRRGHHTLADIFLGRRYYQDDTPIRETQVFGGHAVRALYLASGAVDVAVEAGDDDLLAAIIAQWERTVARRTYLTGGMGSQHTGEAFGEDFALPPDRAYSETCAGVASVMLAWRLLLATGEPRFSDLMERTLFNVVATGAAPDGCSFFYSNPLHKREPGAAPDPDVPSRRAATGMRSPWFSVACCPTNIARTTAALGGYLATKDDAGLQIHQYTDAKIATKLDSGQSLGVEVTTGYPYQGTVRIRITQSDGRPWELTLRVPSWARGSLLIDNGNSTEVSPGVAAVKRAFGIGDEIILRLPVSPRWTRPDPRIDAVRGCVAVERGPLVLCAESVDLQPDQELDLIQVETSSPPQDENGVTRVKGRFHPADDGNWPYRSDEGEEAIDKAADPVDVPLIPYHQWANRGPSTMRVWLPWSP